MSDPTVPRATYDDLVAAPPNKIAQVVDGELHLSPLRGVRQAASLTVLTAVLGQSFVQDTKGSGGWLILSSAKVRLGQDVLVPDLAGWRRESLSAVPDAGPITVVPAWVCEMVSPRTVRLARVAKRSVYCRERVEYLWYVDTNLRTLETLQWQNGRFADVGAYSDDDRIRAVPFDAVELDLGSLWVDSEASSENGSFSIIALQRDRVSSRG